MTAAEVPPLDEAGRTQVRATAARIEARDGSPPLSDAALGRLGSASARHWRADGGYAQLCDGSLEIAAVDPGTVVALLDAVEADVPGSFLVWSHGGGERDGAAGDGVGAALARRGYAKARVLHRLRRGLTELPEPRPLPEGVTLAAFRPGVDEGAWLGVNARAFSSHPEQGRWTRADIEEREREPWFDAGDVLLAWHGTSLRGFHWTKIHPDGAGEVYVLGVDPSAQGTGLGGALLDAGLHHLVARGCTDVLLYVDDDNLSAMCLYERSGFVRAGADVQWRQPPAG